MVSVDLVTKHVYDLIAKQVEDKGLVVWCDATVFKQQVSPRVFNSALVTCIRMGAGAEVYNSRRIRMAASRPGMWPVDLPSLR